ncbi:MAG: Methyl-accepting chemotaxis protein I (serine chemoreceptor protein) [uncultured Paraburkholderia sp.]|nr:MAG: Methyl-accepting chemotaxis protein I (serine chemoreceptor protein) [uncultured Paraburkholderia sp.]
MTSNNEMGRLAAALRKMQESLIATVNSVRQGTEAIDSGVSEIAAGARAGQGVGVAALSF